MTNKRTRARKPYMEECILLGVINSQTVDISKWGLGVEVEDVTLPIKNGDKLSAYIKKIQHGSLTQVQWITKDFKNNTIRLGLKLFSSLLD